MDAWIRDLRPAVIPPLWRQIETRPDGWAFQNGLARLTAIYTGEEHRDGERWLHLSVAHPQRLPTWAEFIDVKEWAMGTERFAAQVIPPRSQYVNFHPYCLHLYSPLVAWPWPDFRRADGML